MPFEEGGVQVQSTDVIEIEAAGSLAGAFRERVARSGERDAYVQFDGRSGEWRHYSWRETADEVARWQSAIRRQGLSTGDRVAVMMPNRREWVVFDQAALGLGLVTVPLYPNDRGQNVAYILRDAGVRLLLIEGQSQWEILGAVRDQLPEDLVIKSLEPVEPFGDGPTPEPPADWLPERAEGPLETRDMALDDLATIVYTSGTTGRPKGVMLSHRNILWNARASLRTIDVFPDDLMLSFLPLSHMLERMAGYYLPILAGSSVAYARSVTQLAEDLVAIRPTILVSVPRIFERVHAKIHLKLEEDSAVARGIFNLAVDVGWRRFEHAQKRAGWSPLLLLWPLLEKIVAAKVQAKLGGRLRFAVSGGAPLSPEIARMFIGLGISIQQGYGLTETSPVISANSLTDNQPASVGAPLEGVEVRVGEHQELITRSPSVMLGYWNDPAATAKTVDAEGWLRTGDQVRLEDGHIYVTGRLKEIIVLANGEKVAPADMEMAIALDDLIEQVLVVGEGRPYLSALIVPEAQAWEVLCSELGLDPAGDESYGDVRVENAILERVQRQLEHFPGYARIRRVALLREPWGIENGMMTPTMKLRRTRILDHCAPTVDALYEGH